jgi:hypothetical protein
MNKKLELTINLFFALPVFIWIGVVLVTLWPANVVVMFGLYTCGLVDVAYAKLPLFRRRVLTSFGPSRIPTQRREAYYRGYRRIALGMALNVLALLHFSILDAVQ